MKIIKVKNYEELSRKAADVIENQINEKKDSVLGLATGSSPLGTYDNLVKDKIDIDKANTHVPSGMSDPDKECVAYEALCEKLGYADLQLLGIGNNGHIGFNEPSEAFAAVTHKVKLTESTIKANSRLFEREEDVPRYAITMGIGTIMKAKKLLLIAGEGKADIVERAISGDVVPSVPASVLQLHPDVTVIYIPKD